MAKEVYPGITQEMIDEVKSKRSNVCVFELDDSEGFNYGHVLLGTPSAGVLNEWEKNLERDPMKSRRLLINGTLCNRVDEIKNWEFNTPQFSALYNAATQMIPVGKATLKKI